MVRNDGAKILDKDRQVNTLILNFKKAFDTYPYELGQIKKYVWFRLQAEKNKGR